MGEMFKLSMVLNLCQIFCGHLSLLINKKDKENVEHIDKTNREKKNDTNKKVQFNHHWIHP